MQWSTSKNKGDNYKKTCRSFPQATNSSNCLRALHLGVAMQHKLSPSFLVQGNAAWKLEVTHWGQMGLQGVAQILLDYHIIRSGIRLRMRCILDREWKGELSILWGSSMIHITVSHFWVKFIQLWIICWWENILHTSFEKTYCSNCTAQHGTFVNSEPTWNEAGGEWVCKCTARHNDRMRRTHFLQFTQ